MFSKCENCEQDHKGDYGSGRFCSSVCARGYSTKAKRGEINNKVSKTLKGKPTGKAIDSQHREKLRAGQLTWMSTRKDNKSFADLSPKDQKAEVFKDQNGKCNGCGISDWRGKPLSLELEHKDGDNKNNQRDNLEILCPNCHSQTPTWRGRNKNKEKRTDQALIAALSSSDSISSALTMLGMAAKGRNYERAKRLITEHKIAMKYLPKSIR